MGISSKRSTIFLIFTIVVTLSSLLPISTSHLAPSPSSSDAASPSPSPSGDDDVSSSSPSISPSSSSSDASSTLTTSPSSSPSSGDDVSSPSPSSSSAMSPSSGDEVSSSSPSTSTSSGETDSSSTSTTTTSSDSSSSAEESSAPAPSPDSSYPSFPTMFSTKFERKMAEAESGMMRTNPTNLVKELCSGAENPSKCMEFFRDSRSDDPAEIIATEIGTLKTLVKEGITAATKVRSRQDGSEAVTHCLDVCLENYDKAMSNLDKATATCSRCIRSNPKCSPKETGEVKTMLSAAISNVGFCDESFNAQGLPDPPMKATNDAVVELTDWLLEFCKKLGQKY
ncbi:hypothetical protein LINGRAHAP2_LOCUS7398 [Linum grandiflorum]